MKNIFAKIKPFLLRNQLYHQRYDPLTKQHSTFEVKYPSLQFHLLSFLNSRPSRSACGHSSLAVVTGPQGSGKSVLIRKVLGQFQRIKAKGRDQQSIQYANDLQSEMQAYQIRIRDGMKFCKDSLSVIYNLQNTPQIHFQSFLLNLHELILLRINSLHSQLRLQHQLLLDTQILLELLFYQVQSRLAIIYAQDFVRCLVDQFHWISISEAQKTKLQQLSDRQVEDSFQLFNQIINILSQGQDLLTTLRVLLCVNYQMQVQLRPPCQASKFQLSGIQSTNFLLSVLDYLCGLHPIIADKIQQRTLGKRYIEQGNHVDCLVVLQNFDRLKSQQQEYFDFLDNLILRSYSSSNIRKGVPIIIQSSNSLFFQKEMFLMGHLDYQHIDIIEIPGINNHLLSSLQINTSFSQREISHLHMFCGVNLSVWQKVLAQFYLSQIPTIIEFLKKHKATINEKQRHQFNAKFNSVFMNPRVQNYLIDRTLHSRIIQIFKRLYRHRGILNVNSLVQQRVVESQVVKSLIQADILFDSFYMDIIYLSKGTDLVFLKQKINQNKSSLRYKLFAARNFLPVFDLVYSFTYYKFRMAWDIRRFKTNTKVSWAYHPRHSVRILAKYYDRFINSDSPVRFQHDLSRIGDKHRQKF